MVCFLPSPRPPKPTCFSTQGFFRGLAPGLVGIIPARSTYFFAYARSKDFWTNNARLGDRHRDLTEVLCGVTAGVVQNTITNPIWMVKTRMQVHSCGVLFAGRKLSVLLALLSVVIPWCPRPPMVRC